MRFLGIDYGTKRVGTALSDEGGQMAFPHEVFKNDKDLIKKITDTIEKNAVKKIVLGHSLNKKGEANPIQEKITELISDLTLETGLPVDLEPEHYSTQEAIRFQGRTDKTDAAAAAVILNSYLTRINNSRNND